jgi:tRNA dimethylallyltransferase
MGSSTASSSPQAPAPSADAHVVAIYGPTASGKSAVARALLDRLDAEVVSADAAALFAGIPVLTAAPDYPARLVGIVGLDRDVSVGEYQRLAHTAIDETIAAGRTAIVVGGTGLYLRAALSSLELPPPPAPGERERWSAQYDADPEQAFALLAERDPDAAARIHPNDRRRVVRALELAATGASLAPAEDRLWSDDMRQPTTLVGLDADTDVLDRRIEARVAEQVAHGVAAEAAAAWSGPLSETARRVLGLELFATMGVDEAAAAVAAASRRLARYQRKWLRRLAVAATLDAGRPPEELADEIVALARAGKRLPRH